MKAVIYKKYGPPSVLELAEVEKPQPKDNEVLIKLFTSTVNRTDCGFRDPQYLPVYLFSGFFTPRRKILGTELSGEVESIGSKVTLFKPGDQVFGLNTFKFGTHAQYVCVSENGSIALKPHNFSHEEAAAVCDGLMLAINYIRRIDFKKHPRIIINGASGSIGSAAVQLAKYYGAHVTAVCSNRSIGLVKSLGADKIVDYENEDFTKSTECFDTILDAVGKSSFFRCKHLLKPGGIYFSSELGYLSQNVFLALLSPFMPGKKVKFPIPTDNQKDTLFFKELIESGKYRAVIDKVYPLEQIVEATNYVESGEKTGNVVLSIHHDGIQ